MLLTDRVIRNRFVPLTSAIERPIRSGRSVCEIHCNVVLLPGRFFRSSTAGKLKFVRLATLVAPVRRNPPFDACEIRRIVI